MRKSDYG